VNENFLAFREQRCDAQSVRIYREYIQPDERARPAGLLSGVLS
jgi:hypothetical protein